MTYQHPCTILLYLLFDLATDMSSSAEPLACNANASRQERFASCRTSCSSGLCSTIPYVMEGAACQAPCPEVACCLHLLLPPAVQLCIALPANKCLSSCASGVVPACLVYSQPQCLPPVFEAAPGMEGCALVQAVEVRQSGTEVCSLTDACSSHCCPLDHCCSCQLALSGLHYIVHSLLIQQRHAVHSRKATRS